jgi:diaminopimelate epimerase
MPILFRKIHAHGDDFIVVDRRGQDDPITPRMWRDGWATEAPE